MKRDRAAKEREITNRVECDVENVISSNRTCDF